MSKPTKGAVIQGKYTKYTAAIVTDMVRNHWSSDEIASALQVSPTTLKRWLSTREDLQQAVAEAQRPREAEVEAALFELAVGATEEKVTERFACDPQTGQLFPTAKEVTTVKHPPDFKAGVFWLKNRRPETWQDRQEHDVRSVAVTLNLDAADSKL